MAEQRGRFGDGNKRQDAFISAGFEPVGPKPLRECATGNSAVKGRATGVTRDPKQIWAKSFGDQNN